MSISTRIDGSPDDITTVGVWVQGRLQPALTDALGALRSAESEAQAGWKGTAGSAFVTRMSSCRSGVQKIADDGERVGAKLKLYATALQTAQDDMRQVRTDASAAGLSLTPGTIEDPGAGPGKPWRSGELSPEQAREFDRMTAEYEDHQKKIAAYDHAQSSASRVETALESAKGVLTTFVSELTGKWHLNSADFVVGAAAMYTGRHASILTKHAAALADDAKRHLDHYVKSPGGSPESKYNNRRIFESRLASAEAKARGVKWAGVASKLDKGGPALALVGTGLDIAQGKSPGKAILSGGVGLGAGALLVASAPVSAPVLLVGAGAVGVGIVGSMVADKVWDDVVPEGAKKAIDGGLKAVGGGAKHVWNKVF